MGWQDEVDTKTPLSDEEIDSYAAWLTERGLDGDAERVMMVGHNSGEDVCPMCAYVVRSPR